MYMTHITTSFFQLNIEKLYSRMISRSLLVRLLGKSANVILSNLRKSVMTKIISIYSLPSRRSGVLQKWFASLNLLPPNNSSSDFPSLKKSSGEVNSGAMGFISQLLASGVTGPQSSGMWQTKEKRWVVNHNSYIYSLRSSLGSYLVGSAPR